MENDNVICRVRTCQFREMISDEEIIKRKLDFSHKPKTCEFSESGLCKGNRIFLRPPNLPMGNDIN